MIIAILKPKGPSSNQLLTEVKKVTGIKKVGHAGTLDPLASGVLVVGIGRQSTKLLDQVVKKEKEYLATIKLGQTSTTDDEEGNKTEISVKQTPDLKQVETAVKKFIGTILQTPPTYSAIKVNGKEAYKYARAGKEVQLKTKPVQIKEIEILEYDWPLLKLRVVTGAGVYIRSLAKDLGQELKTGGYLAELERIRVGEFSKDQAVSVSQLTKLNID